MNAIWIPQQNCKQNTANVKWKESIIWKKQISETTTVMNTLSYRRIKLLTNKLVLVSTNIPQWNNIDSSLTEGNKFNFSKSYKQDSKETIEAEMLQYLSNIQQIYPNIEANDLKVANVFENDSRTPMLEIHFYRTKIMYLRLWIKMAILCLY